MKLSYKTNASFTVQLELTDRQAKALDALVGYGFKQFLEIFYTNLGKHYLQPYEKDLEQLFDAIRAQVLPEIELIDRCKKAFIASASDINNAKQAQ